MQSAFLAGLLAVPCRAGEVEDYLTKDGKLKEACHSQNWRNRVFGSSRRGMDCQTVGRLGLRNLPSPNGRLSAKQLAALAQHLATQDFNSLPKMQGYELKGPVGHGGYVYVVITFGKKEAKFNTKSGNHAPTISRNRAIRKSRRGHGLSRWSWFWPTCSKCPNSRKSKGSNRSDPIYSGRTSRCRRSGGHDGFPRYTTKGRSSRLSA